MKNNIFSRLTSLSCAAVMMLSSFCRPVSAVETLGEPAAETDIIYNDEKELCQQVIELYPNGEETGQVITLDGLMPQGASAEAVDVSDEHEGIAAFDITISDGDSEFQPDEENPILVEITDPVIPEAGNIELWHIQNDGSREQIFDFTMTETGVSFYAEGFSIYEIVELTDISGADVTGFYKLKSFDDIKAYAEQGIYIGSARNGLNSTNHFFTGEAVNTTDGKKTPGIAKTKSTFLLKEQTDISQYSNFVSGSLPAVPYYFEVIEELAGQTPIPNNSNVLDIMNCRIYCMDGDTRKYIHHEVANNADSSGFNFVNSADDASVMTVFKKKDNNNFFYIRDADSDKWTFMNEWGGTGYGTKAMIFGGWDYEDSAVYQFWAYNPAEFDPNELDGKDYGIFYYSEGATKGNALMAEGDSHSLIKLILTADGNNRVLYVDENNEIDRWTFSYDSTDGTYTLSNGSGKYLCADQSGVSVTDNAEAAGKFNVRLGGDKRVKLSCNGNYMKFDGSGFTTTTDDSDTATWLELLDRAEMEENDLITFSADRVSVSDIPNGQRVIIYMRIWNEKTLSYDMYAVDRDGSLYPCYAEGGKIMWLGDGTVSLEWEFTEYYDEVTKQPNYYYELYNPYSEKYLAPKMADGQVLSDSKIGINLPGRRNGDFYSEAIAWDEDRYAYIGLRPNADKTALEPCAEAVSLPFYFATLEELNLSDRLHKVPTLDNNDYGISMKMVDFGFKEGSNNYGGAVDADITDKYFGGSASTGTLKTGLLSKTLKENGYPDTKENINLSGAYADAMPVNHLFLERVHHSSGYFEYDSGQNFATLRKPDDPTAFNTTNGVTDFTVYRELGTHDRGGGDNALNHGQFFPYDTILPGVYSERNPVNISNAYEKDLDNSDPRKYESLHKIQTTQTESTSSHKNEANYYFGMEMEASFVQTPSGLDAWGHDIIFEFTGDDDFWLYIDEQLVLDLGGTHAAMQGKVNFRTGEVIYDKNNKKYHDANDMGKTDLLTIFTNNYKETHTDWTDAGLNEYLSQYFAKDANGEFEKIFKDYSAHKMKIFYMERGGNASNLYMRFNIASVTPGHVVVSKEVTGSGADAIDKDFLEYPFQIFYTLPDGENGEPGAERPLINDDEHIPVTYQNSSLPVTFIQNYRPPGATAANSFSNVFFINPTKRFEIAFPDDTITYRIVECAVDPTVYTVAINGEKIDETSSRVEIKGDLRSYSSDTQSAQEMPSISFDNIVDDVVVRDLYFTKKLVDEDGKEITNDPTTFSFRLYLSPYQVEEEKIPAANMRSYYVLDKERHICRFDPVTRAFQDTGYLYTRELIRNIKNGTVTITEETVTRTLNESEVIFTTSGFGAISGIPSGYTVCVPGLPAGTMFKVTEDTKTGYGLDRYEQILGSKTQDGKSEDVASFTRIDGQDNIGKVIADQNPQLNVINKKGYSLTVNKKWSDQKLTTAHETVYTAVYVDDVLLDGSVRAIVSPKTSAYYFWTTLKDGRTSLDDYSVREVTVSGDNIKISADGTVTGYDTVIPVSVGDKLTLNATRTASATPEGESREKSFNYAVSYQNGDFDGSSRSDTITNTRDGGLGIRLFKWGDTERSFPLSGGVFTLKDSSGNIVGTYTSDSDGIVTMLYDFERSVPYTLTQTTAPRGYVGLQKSVKFTIHDDDSISLSNDDGQTWEGDDTKWVDTASASSGVIGYVDVFNKPFNFKIAKMDSSDSDVKLGDAHFALYKQTNTSISGLVKNKDPIKGFEDMTTDADGMIDVCGGESSRTIDPGVNGSVYFLEETQAPDKYAILKNDIIFRISPIGVPSLISDSYNGNLVETENSYIYTLSVPNIKQSSMKPLTIRKQVSGAFGNKQKDFDFTITVKSEAPAELLDWSKNGEDQETPLSSTDGTFTMQHNDEIVIMVPIGAEVTITEDNLEYQTTFALDESEAQNGNSITFDFTDEQTLTVTNNLDGDIPTGINSTLKNFLILAFISGLAISIQLFIIRKRAKADR